VSIEKKVALSAKRRALRSKAHLANPSGLMRVSVFRSARHIYVQLVNDLDRKTIVSCSSLEMKKLSGDKKEVARSVGLELAAKAKKAGVEAAVFDRGSYLYHGRVKALADGLREGGIKV